MNKQRSPLGNYIAGQWREVGAETSIQELEEAFTAARKSFPDWSTLPFEVRADYLRLYAKKLQKSTLATTISQETGKPLWESSQEVASMINKIDLAIEAYKERCPEKKISLGSTTLCVHHKPHGVVGVFGPFNFPGHLPNGHIVPALLAGNTVIFKGSEFTPLVSQEMVRLWQDLPSGVLNLVQGGPQTGKNILTNPQLDGLFFTGSFNTGSAILNALCPYPQKILALEMGGNNPLLFLDSVDLTAAAYVTIQSAFLSAGQRCTCARRLIVPDDQIGEKFLKVLVEMASKIKVGHYTEIPEPFMGPVIHLKSAEGLLKAQTELVNQGGIPLLEMHTIRENTPFLSPGIMDVTLVQARKDEEFFGPFLQVIRTPSFEEAIKEANRTSYGLVASIITKDREKFKTFYHSIRAGVINWNTPTTGASSRAPFGGVGKSGNYRPSGYYAADYCAYPVASLESEQLTPQNAS